MEKRNTTFVSEITYPPEWGSTEDLNNIKINFIWPGKLIMAHPDREPYLYNIKTKEFTKLEPDYETSNL